jgi:UDP-N-acetyl-D-mannosaminuronic acid dehydrogenase
VTVAERLQDRSARVAIVGLGRVGLPLAIALARAGLRVLGLETEPGRRKAIELGKMPFHEPASEPGLAESVKSGTLTAHEDPKEVVPNVDVIILSVGTPLSSEFRPDYGQLHGALAQLAPHLKAGQLLVLRSTLSPGTLEKVVAPYLHEHVPDVADELLLAACPERIAEGRATEELLTLPEIVGGIDHRSSEAAAALFRVLNPNKRIHFTDPISAELAKLFTNVYRYVNFALANEFAILGEHYQVDVHRIIEMVNADYPRAQVPSPGPAGGPCLSKDGYFLVEDLSLPDFVLLAWKLNESVPAHVVRRLARQLDSHGIPLSGTPVAVLGQTFKRDSDDLRQSPAVRVTEILNREGALVKSHDPFLAGPTLQEALQGARAFVLATNHSFYETLKPQDIAELMVEPRIGVDCWGVLDHQAFGAAGVSVATFGIGQEP